MIGTLGKKKNITIRLSKSSERDQRIIAWFKGLEERNDTTFAESLRCAIRAHINNEPKKCIGIINNERIETIHNMAAESEDKNYLFFTYTISSEDDIVNKFVLDIKKNNGKYGPMLKTILYNHIKVSLNNEEWYPDKIYLSK